MFEKKDLQGGDRFVCRNKDVYYVSSRFFDFETVDAKKIGNLNNFNPDLTHGSHKEFDIIKVTRKGVLMFDREQQEIQAKMQADHEARKQEYKAKKDAGAYDHVLTLENNGVSGNALNFIAPEYTTKEIDDVLSNGLNFDWITLDFWGLKDWFNATVKVLPEQEASDQACGEYINFEELKLLATEIVNGNTKIEEFNGMDARFLHELDAEIERQKQIVQSALSEPKSSLIQNQDHLNKDQLEWIKSAPAQVVRIGSIVDSIELLRTLPESVQLVIVNAMSDEKKVSLIGL